MGMYREIVRESEQRGGSWSHPIYSRGRRGGGFKTAMKKLGQKLKQVGKQVKGDMLQGALEFGTDVMLKGVDPAAAAKKQLTKRGPGMAKGAFQVLTKKQRGAGMINQKQTQRSRSNQKRIVYTSRELVPNI